MASLNSRTCISVIKKREESRTCMHHMSIHSLLKLNTKIIFLQNQ
uniref:Uncharacterized protein n=1 Tax=Arundo donax TaxID=35708 RepID=A0A0A9FWM1_ARUDO